MMRPLLLLFALGLPTHMAPAQTLPMRPHRMGVPVAPSRTALPSVLRNQTPPPATMPAPPLSAQDRQAYEHCPDPRRYGPRRGAKKLVRIW